MFYLFVPLIGITILLIINFDVLFNRHYVAYNKKALGSYRLFLITIGIYYLSDILWGILDPLPDKIYAFIDTSVYFVSMALLLWAWTHFIVNFISGLKISKYFLRILGFSYLVVGVVLVITNFFHPVLFSYDSSVYVPATGRYIYLGTQTTVFLITSIYAFVNTLRKEGYKKGQFFTLTLFGLVMLLFIGIQMYYPEYPLYAMGCIVGSVLIHTFIVVSTKLQNARALTESKELVKEQSLEIEATKELAYLDPLTGVKNKHAYVELEQKFDKLIRDGKVEEFSFFIFDLNDLKLINDTYGHDMGDQYIIKSVEIIKKHFKDVEIYRYGGDEFVAILEGRAFEDRFESLAGFNQEIEESKEKTDPIIAVGFSDFVREKDNTLRNVFLRADDRMYSRKKRLKELFDRASPNPSTKDATKARGVSLMDVRFELYKMFYHSQDVSLIDMLNSSSCDEIVEFDIENDTFKQLYHVDGKYFVPTVGLSYKDLLDFTYKYIIHPDDRGVYMGLMKIDGFFERLANSRIPDFDFAHFRYKLQDGSYRWVEQVVITGDQYGIPKGMFRMYVFDIHNIKSRQLGKISNKSIAVAVGRDPVTGLLSSKDFLVKAQDAASAEPNKNWCLVTLDIEHFKLFDEWFGREKGNLLLANIGVILKEFEEKNRAIAGYFGQDDFTVFFEYDADKLQKLYGDIHEIIISYGLTAGFLPAFGVAMIEKDMVVVDAFDRATIAATNAKKDLKTRIVVYNTEMQFSVTNEYRILTDFMHAIQNDEITFYLQPQCEITTGQVVGAEALARWIKKDGTFVSPGEFVPVLEKYAFITDLDKFMWEKVCKWIRAWLDAGHKMVPISLNVSQIDIFNVDIDKYFIELTEKYKIPRKYLKIEITESAYAETTSVVDELVKKLRSDGFMVMMDDFGSGYSSLNMLSTLKIDAIKLDAQFLKFEGSETNKGIHILESVINMAKTMALPIIAEGAERKEQVDFLENLGVHYVQGFYFYKPMPADEFEKIIVDPKNVDKSGFHANLNEQFRIREFLDSNIYSDSMLNNIIGAVAIYSATKNHVDIVRFNQQFRDSVDVPEFADRLVNIEQFVPESERPAFFAALKEAKENKLNGATGVFKFARADGLFASFKMHFYYIGRKEGTDRYYGSATNVSELNDLVENKKLVAKFSKDNIIFINRIRDKWHYSVISHSLSDVIGLSPEELEEELNNGSFAKRIVPPKALKNFMMEIEEKYAKTKDFHIEKEFDALNTKNEKFKLYITIDYVGSESSNVAYVLRTKLRKDEQKTH